MIYNYINVENTEMSVDKKTGSKNRLLPLFFVFFLTLLCIFLMPLRFKESFLNHIFGNKNDTYNQNTSSEDLNKNDKSPFSEFVKQDSSTINLANTFNEVSEKSLDKSLIYDINIRAYGEDSWDKVLDEGDSMVEVFSEDNGIKSYKLIYSKNPSLKYFPGDKINFRLVITDSKSLVIIDGSNIKNEFEDSDIEGFESDLLEVGDKVAFTCKEDSCIDGLVNWILVIKK